MDNFQIETAQNVSIIQNVAGVGERILAFLIDGALLVFYMVLANFLMGALDYGGGERQIFSMVAIGLPVFLYSLVWETFWNGQTPGKAAMEIRVVKVDGSRPAFSNYLIRWLLRIIDITISSGSVAVVTILLNGKGQRLGDMAAATTVVSEKAKVSLQKNLTMDMPEDYVPKYPQVTVLSDKDIQQIRNLYRDARKHSNGKVLRSLSDKVSNLLEVNPQEGPGDFIKKVLQDYKYYTQR